jgi:hypothetical protein
MSLEERKPASKPSDAISLESDIAVQARERLRLATVTHRIDHWLEYERRTFEIARSCRNPEDRARWLAITQLWAALAHIEAASGSCGGLRPADSKIQLS